MDEKITPAFKIPAALSASDQREKAFREIVEKERAQTDAKTARLKALRLAKEAANKASAPPPAPAPIPRRKGKRPI